MKILIYADAHFSLNSSILTGSANSLNGRLQHLIDSFDWMYNLARKSKIDLIVNLGDLADSSRLSAEEITAISMSLAKNTTITENHILGNHERLSNDGRINSINFVNAIPNHHLIIENMIDNDNSITYIPYGYYQDGDLDDLPDTNICFSHLDIYGSDIGTGWSLTSGMSPQYLASKYKWVINGHIHAHSYVLNTATSKVLNLGSLSGQNFSSKGVPHVAILDTKKDKLTFYDNPHGLYFMNKVCNNLSEVISLVNDLKDNMSYALQLKIPSSIADDTREIINNKKCILTSRLKLKMSTSQLDNESSLDFLADEEIDKVSTISGGFAKLREFLDTKDNLPQNKDDILKVINELEQNNL